MANNTIVVFAQAISPNKSQIEWILGEFSYSSVLVLLSAGLIFAGACYLVATRRRPAVLAAWLVLLPLPLIISLCDWMMGAIASLTVIAATPDIVITDGDFAGANADSLLNLLVAVLVSAPSYFVLAFGLLKSTLHPPAQSGADMVSHSTNPAAPRELMPVAAKPFPAVS